MPRLGFGECLGTIYYNAVSTISVSGGFLFHVFGALAQFERSLTQERVRAGLVAARRRGRRVKEQQKRIGSAEFHNTQFSYSMGLDGIEHFVTTPELQRVGSIGSDPLPPGQIFAIGPGGHDEATNLYRIEVTEGPGSGVRMRGGSRSAAPRPNASRAVRLFPRERNYWRADGAASARLRQ